MINIIVFTGKVIFAYYTDVNESLITYLYPFNPINLYPLIGYNRIIYQI